MRGRRKPPVKERLCRLIAVMQLHEEALADIGKGRNRHRQYFKHLRNRLACDLTPRDLADIRLYMFEISKEADQAIEQGYPDKYHTGG